MLGHSTKRRNNSLGRKQTGDMLIESIVALGIVGIIAVGPAYVTSRTSVSQFQNNMHAQVVGKMRNLLHDSGSSLCVNAPPPITLADKTLDIQVTCSPLVASSVTVGGVAVNLTGSTIEKKVSLSVTNVALFGGSGTINLSQ